MKTPAPSRRHPSPARARSRALKITRLLAGLVALSLLQAESAPAWNFAGAAAGGGLATGAREGVTNRARESAAADDAPRGAEPGGVRLPRLKLSAERERAAGSPEEESQEVQSLRRAGARPLSLASADFDEDGVPDLVTGYGAGARGAITLRRGNADAIFPNSPEAQERKRAKRFSGAPFLAASGYADAPARPDLIGAGDFDGDSHFDIVAAERGGETLHLLAGDGAGNFAAPREVRLAGRATALVVGEMNQADGLADVVVAIEGLAGARLLVFEGPSGAINSEPEIIALPARAASLALGQLDAESAFDLAAAAGPGLVVVHGRDRKLTRRAAERDAAAPARVESLRLGTAIMSVAVGDFEVGRGDEIALLTDDGSVRILSAQAEGDSAKTGEAWAGSAAREEVPDVAAWRRAEVAGGLWPRAESLVGAKVSAYAGQDIVLLDGAGRSLHLLAGDKLDAAAARATETAADAHAAPDGSAAARDEGARASLPAGGAPVAVLPMRLDADALQDLVFATGEEFDPATALTSRPARVRLNGTRRGAADRGAKTSSAAQAALANAPSLARERLLREGATGARAAKPDGKAERAAPLPVSPSACTPLPLGIGQSFNGALEAGDCRFATGEFYDEFTFTSQTNHRVAIGLTSPGFDTYLYLLAPDGSILATDDDGGGGPNGTDSRIPAAGLDFFTLPADGQYTIRVSSFFPNVTGAYQVALASGTNVCAPAPLVLAANGTASISGSLLDGDCRNANGTFGDWYAFNGSAGQQLRLVLSSTAFDPVLHFFAPNGALLAVSDDNYLTREAVLPTGGNFVTLPATGTYFVLATSFSPRSTGAYQFGIVSNTTPCPVIPLLYDDIFFDSLTVFDCSFLDSFNGRHYYDTYSFVGRQNDRIAVEMFSDDFDPYLFLFGPTGSWQGGSGGLGFFANIPASGFLTLPASGIYFIQTTSNFPNNFGSYDVSLFIEERTTVVTTTADNGNDDSPTNGSLRQAIVRANANPGADTITFNIAGAGVKIIAPTVPLPALTGPTTIDATTQPGYAGTPVVELNGLNAGPHGVGLKLLGGSSRVRGLAINRWGSAGVAVAGLGGNIIDGNHIGTDPAGQIARPYTAAAAGDKRESQGVIIDSSRDNTVGGTTAAARNVISGNRNVGVLIERSLWFFPITGNRVQGNHIGTNLAGTTDLGNGYNGVVFLTGVNNHVGGTAAGARNVISGNNAPGVALGATSFLDGNLVQGNYIGTNAAGTAAVGNTGGGVIIGGALERDHPYFQSLVRAVNNRVGGTTAAARNVISGNLDGSGVNIINTGSEANVVEGNYIGTNAAGTAALANAGAGVFVTFASGNLIGGSAAGAGNLISGNGWHGVAVALPFQNPITGEITAGRTGVSIINNRIGTNAVGTAALANAGDGIIIAAEAVNNLVQGNIIAHNAGNGVNIPDLTPGSKGLPGLQNTLDANSIYANALLGIDLHQPGVTPNDPLDADEGANLQQNFPTLTSAFISPAAPPPAGGGDASASAEPSPSPVTVMGTLRSAPDTLFSVNWYFSAGPCVNNQSRSEPLDSGRIPNVLTDSQGNATVAIPLNFPPNLTAGVINTTATDPVGNTSEFSPCLPVSAPTAPATGFEGDVWPRPGGSNAGTLTLSDYALAGRFYVGAERASAGSEFQRADCWPLGTKGDGRIMLADFMQAGRFFVGLDAAQSAGGPTAAATTGAAATSLFKIAGADPPAGGSAEGGGRVLSVGDVAGRPGDEVSLPVVLTALGGEAALSFSVSFDPRSLTLVRARLGGGVPAGAAFAENGAGAAQGRYGAAVVLPAGARLGAGGREILVMTFRLAKGARGASAVAVGSMPVAGEVLGFDLMPLPTEARAGSVRALGLPGRAEPPRGKRGQ